MQAHFAGLQVNRLVVFLLQVDDAVHAESLDRHAGQRIQRHQLVARRHIDNAVILLAVRPIRHAMAGILPRGVAAAGAFVDGMHPAHFAGGGIQTDHGAARTGGAIEPAGDHQRRALIDIFRARPQLVRLEAPGHFQLAEIVGIDLVQRRIAGVGQVAGIVAPFGVGGPTSIFGDALRPGGQACGDQACDAGQHQATAGLRQHFQAPCSCYNSIRWRGAAGAPPGKRNAMNSDVKLRPPMASTIYCRPFSI